MTFPSLTSPEAIAKDEGGGCGRKRRRAISVHPHRHRIIIPGNRATAVGRKTMNLIPKSALKRTSFGTSKDLQRHHVHSRNRLTVSDRLSDSIGKISWTITGHGDGKTKQRMLGSRIGDQMLMVSSRQKRIRISRKPLLR